MIKEVSLSAQTIEVGQEIELKVFGDGPFRVAVKCFVFEPKPPGYRECPECAVKTIGEGEALVIRANLDTWRSSRGELRVEVVDKKSNRRELVVPVEPWKGSNSAPEAMSTV